MRLLIIDQCSGSKNVPEDFDQFDESDLEIHTREELIDRQGVPALPARDLYRGRQQQFVGNAVDRLRENGDSVDRIFISAGFGVVDEETKLPPYNVTFSDYSEEEIEDRSHKLGIHEDILHRIRTTPVYDVVFFILGTDYYQSLDLIEIMEELPDSTIGVLFNQDGRTDPYRNVISIPARTDEAKENGTIVVALKGRYLQNFAEHRAHGATVENPDDIEMYCTTEYTTQSTIEEYDS